MAVPLLGLVAEIGASILGPLFGIIDQAVPDKDLAAKLKADIQVAVLRIQEKTLESQKDIIVAEAQGESPLQRMWRPAFMILLMVSMVVSVVGGMLGFGDNIAEGWNSINDNAWLLMQIGLGGYIGGRTIEKTAKSVITWKK
jgi:hypothetical protein